MKIFFRRIRIAAVLAGMLLIQVSWGYASSVRQVGVDEMVRESQLVFEGTVAAIEAREDGKGRIHTHVTFSIQEVIKGNYPHETVTLRFLGGSLGDVTTSVSDMQFPQVGEHGIYFVESLKRVQVHPLYGWSQGHFLVEQDADGRQRVRTSRGKPVTEVLDEAMADDAAEEVSPTHGNGVARGLAVAREKKGHPGLTIDEFKTALHEKMRRRK